MLEALYKLKFDPMLCFQKENVLSVQLFDAIPRRCVNNATQFLHYAVVVMLSPKKVN